MLVMTRSARMSLVKRLMLVTKDECVVETGTMKLSVPLEIIYGVVLRL